MDSEEDRKARIEREMQQQYAATEAEWPNGTGKFNVLIAGKTGVGKSTLLNAVFGVEVAGTGSGASQTEKLRPYNIPGKPVTIYDTRGFETDNPEVTVKLDQEIAALRKAPNEADQLHVVWLCVLQSNKRFEEHHVEFVARMRKLFLPVIVVVTQSDQEPEVLEEFIGKRVGADVPVLNVMAQDKITRAGKLDSYGVQQLADVTADLLPPARRPALAAAQVVSPRLKKKEATKIILAAAGAAALAAASPIPGSDLIGIAGVQAGMMAKLDKIAGLESAGVMHYAKLAGASMARAGGVRLFGLLSAQMLKLLPGLGTGAGDAIAVAVAGSVTTALGYGYWTAAKLARSSDGVIDTNTVINEFKRHRDSGGDATPATA